MTQNIVHRGLAQPSKPPIGLRKFREENDGENEALQGEDPTAAARLESHKALSHSLKSVQKRDAILRAAIEIINAKSFALATMTEIAATLDLRDAALYYYFPNKQALVYACHQSSLERFGRILDDADQAGGDGFDKLQRFLTALMIDSARNGPQLYFGDHSYLDEAQRETVTVWGERLTGVLERFIDEGMADGSVVPCESKLVVQLLLGMLIWLAKWVPTVEGITVDRLMAAIGVVTLHGLERRERLAEPSRPTPQAPSSAS
jgi:AcrR family transcriptional regulator